MINSRNYPVRVKRIAALTLAALLLTGCSRSTRISREEHLFYLTGEPGPSNTDPAEPATVTTGEPTVSAQIPPDTTGTTTLPATEGKPAENTQAPSRPKATKPKDTKPPASTQPPETTGPGETAAPETDPGQTDDPYDISGYTLGSLECAIAEHINAQRTAAGLPALELSGRLSAISSARAYEIAVSFSHTRPDGRGCFTVLSDYGYSGYSAAGENLLQCSEGFSSEDMVTMWMNSSGHRENILSGDFTTIGIGVYRSGGMIYVANLFAG